MNKLLISALCLTLPLTSIAGGKNDDPLLTKVMIGQFETRSTDGADPLVVEADAWIGRDLNKFWMKMDLERVDNETEELELQFLYSKAIAPYWDAQIGWRHDGGETPDRDYLALGFQGVAPYFFEVDSALFIGTEGQIGLRLDAEYEAMLTQRLILSPEVSFHMHSQNDEEVGIGSGLSTSEIGLRLRYEIKREFAPYIGVNWTKKYGTTADYAIAEGADDDDVQIVAGFRTWF